MRKPQLLLSLMLCVLFSSPLLAAETYTTGQKTNKTFEGFARPFLENNCFDCHNDLVNKEPPYNPEKPGLRAHGDVVPIDPEGARKIYFALDRLNGRGGPSFRRALKSITSVLASARSHGLDNYPTLTSVNSIESLQILDQAKDITRFMAYGPESFVPNPDKQITDGRPKILPATSDPANVYYNTEVVGPLTPVYELMKSVDVTDDQMRAAVDYLFEALTFRPPSKRESDQHLQIVKDAVTELGLEKGAPIGLSVLFLNRDALFRPELVEDGTPDAHGRVMLQDWELGLAVNHALRFVKPDKKFKDAITSGRMRTREDVKREVERILNDESIRKPRVSQFFRDYFDYDLAGHVNKDANLLIGTRVVSNPTHSCINVPIILSGGEAMGIKQGQYLKFDHTVPLTNLYLTMLDKLGAPQESFADSTGQIRTVSKG